MKKPAIIFGVTLTLLLVAYVMMPTLAWDGGAMVEFRFHAVDSSGQRPIEGAKVRVLRHDQLADLSDTNMAVMLPVTATDATGNATVSVVCGAGGSKGMLGKTGNFIISQELAVEADGYRPLQSALANIVGGRRWPLSKRVFDVELLLVKNP